MRFMIIVKSNNEAAEGCAKDEKFFGEMKKFNDDLARAGALLALEGLHPSSQGARVKLATGQQSVTDGPFPETKEIIGGYWLWEMKSKEEAIQWVRRCPVPPQGEMEIEIREVRDPEEFSARFAPSLYAPVQQAPAAGKRAARSH